MLQVSMLWFRSLSALVPWLCGLKDLFQFAEGLRAGESWLGRPGLTADRRVQHPEGHLQNSRWLDFFQAAMRHRLAALYQSCMHPHWSAVPWVPGIADFTNIPNMGVVLLSCTIKTVFTIPWERTRRIEGLWSRSQQRTQPSIPCPAWVGCTIATAGVRRRNRQFELTGRLFDERSGCRASGVAVGATAADSDEACAPDFRRSPSCELLVRHAKAVAWTSSLR